MIGAGSLVPPRKVLKSGYLYVGSPVQQVRPLTEKELAFLPYSARHYVKVQNNHKIVKSNFAIFSLIDTYIALTKIRNL